MSGESNGCRVKVVIINTQYVETDAGSFKSVVQRLTGKDSKVKVAAKPSPPPSGFNGQRKRHSGRGILAKTDQPHLPTVVPFNDFDIDRLQFRKELSRLDELHGLYAQ